MITDALTWQLTQIPFTREISENQRNLLKEYSSEEIIRGVILKLEGYDQDDQTRLRAYVGNDVTSMLQFNADLVPDITELRTELAREQNPRRFYHLSGLAYAFTRARNADFIPELFNTLFRDGRVITYQGESTPSYAGNVSKLAQMWITGTLERLDASYRGPESNGAVLPTHEQEVEHLAKWLIGNWPGCENFTLSDQNVPAILASRSPKRVSGQLKSQNRDRPHTSAEPFKISWPMISAIVFLVGSLAYWGKKRSA